jgi:hypothetical protein
MEKLTSDVSEMILSQIIPSEQVLQLMPFFCQRVAAMLSFFTSRISDETIIMASLESLLRCRGLLEHACLIGSIDGRLLPMLAEVRVKLEEYFRKAIRAPTLSTGSSKDSGGTVASTSQSRNNENDDLCASCKGSGSGSGDGDGDCNANESNQPSTAIKMILELIRGNNRLSNKSLTGASSSSASEKSFFAGEDARACTLLGAAIMGCVELEGALPATNQLTPAESDSGSRLVNEGIVLKAMNITVESLGKVSKWEIFLFH